MWRPSHGIQALKVHILLLLVTVRESNEKLYFNVFSIF